jgi:hypothetical protein
MLERHLQFIWEKSDVDISVYRFVCSPFTVLYWPSGSCGYGTECRSSDSRSGLPTTVGCTRQIQYKPILTPWMDQYVNNDSYTTNGIKDKTFNGGKILQMEILGQNYNTTSILRCPHATNSGKILFGTTYTVFKFSLCYMSISSTIIYANFPCSCSSCYLPVAFCGERRHALSVSDASPTLRPWPASFVIQARLFTKQKIITTVARITFLLSL